MSSIANAIPTLSTKIRPLKDYICFVFSLQLYFTCFNMSYSLSTGPLGLLEGMTV